MSPDTPQMTADQKKREAEYQAEDDLRTLSRAAQIKADPERLRLARAMAKKQIKELNGVTKDEE